MHKILSHHPLKKKKECQEFNNDQDLEPPTDDLLDLIASQQHSEDQLDQVLQTYQAYQETESRTETPNRQMNIHSLTMLIKQIK